MEPFRADPARVTGLTQRRYADPSNRPFMRINLGGRTHAHRGVRAPWKRVIGRPLFRQIRGSSRAGRSSVSLMGAERGSSRASTRDRLSPGCVRDASGNAATLCGRAKTGQPHSDRRRGRFRRSRTLWHVAGQDGTWPGHLVNRPVASGEQSSSSGPGRNTPHRVQASNEGSAVRAVHGPSGSRTPLSTIGVQVDHALTGPHGVRTSPVSTPSVSTPTIGIVAGHTPKPTFPNADRTCRVSTGSTSRARSSSPEEASPS